MLVAGAFVAVGTATLTTGMASGATLTEYCLSGGGRVITIADPPRGAITYCEGGKFDGMLISR
ncbi:hypothetical protein [Nocardia sp. NPDC057353]|uniref:hypothetical protein n=1 Tax=Nocardia sp. NPDC057353 TaxID=3346104 RepID=UPI0036306001